MPRTFTIPDDLADQTLAAALRKLAGPLSWAEAKRLITTRRVDVNDTLTLNDARRVTAGDTITLHDQSKNPVPREQDIRLLHIDPHLIVLDKPAGMITLRRDEEQHFSDQRKDLQPSLDELIPKLLPGPRNRKPPALYAVHRLDRDTSGLMLFALTPRARDALIALFSRHHIDRSYVAVLHGLLREPRTIDTLLVRDRGDGLRGTLPPGRTPDDARRAVTHLAPLEPIAGEYTLAQCRLETGRTHQIRIHCAEIGHPLCGERLYDAPRPDPSNAPRQALHSTHLQFTHPLTDRPMEFDSPLPKDLSAWLTRLRATNRPAPSPSAPAGTPAASPATPNPSSPGSPPPPAPR